MMLSQPNSLIPTAALLLFATQASADFWVATGNTYTEGGGVSGLPVTTSILHFGIFPTDREFKAKDVNDFNSDPTDGSTINSPYFQIRIKDGSCGMPDSTTLNFYEAADHDHYDAFFDGGGQMGSCVRDTSQGSDELTGCCPQSMIWESIYRCTSDWC